MTDVLQAPLLLMRRWYRKLWLRVTLYALLSVIVAATGPFLASFLPIGLTGRVGPEAVLPVLTILASSMLAVSTFSLNVMVSAQNAASDRATPRLHRLMLEDTTTQSVLAVFVGAFVYALTTLILFRAGFFADEAAVVVMAVTVLVVVLVIVAMLRWIDHLSRLGSLDDSLRLATEHASTSLDAAARRSALGAEPLTSETVLPDDLTPVAAPWSGYVQIIDVAGLESCLPGVSRAYVSCAPGRHVLRGQPVALISGKVSGEARGKIAACFVIGEMRTSEQDPVFGLETLSEISAKALSPGVNDPGTAIETITRQKELLWAYADAAQTPKAPGFPRVFVPEVPAALLVEAAFAAAARDGAGMVEVASTLQKALRTLADTPDSGLNEAAQAMASKALAYSDAALTLDEDKARLRGIAEGS